MALTFTMDGQYSAPQRHHGGRKRWVGTITFDASYAAGGYSVAQTTTGVISGTTNPFGMYNKIESIVFQSFHKKYFFDFDRTNQKIRAFYRQHLTGATATADATLGALGVDNTGAETVHRLMGTAASTAYDTVNSVEAPTNDAQLSGVVANVEVIGY